MKLEAAARLRATQLRHPDAQRSGKHQDWFYKLEEKARSKYAKKHPGTKFRSQPNLKTDS
jgi:hypothetical protein